MWEECAKYLEDKLGFENRDLVTRLTNNLYLLAVNKNYLKIGMLS